MANEKNATPVTLSTNEKIQNALNAWRNGDFRKAAEIYLSLSQTETVKFFQEGMKRNRGEKAFGIADCSDLLLMLSAMAK